MTTGGATKLHTAYFPHVQANAPKLHRVSWEKLTEILTSHTRRAEKDGPLWSPTEYAPGATRAKANVLSVSCLVMDLDAGTAPESLTRKWDAAGLEYVAYSTHSHTPEHPKWRAVFPLREAVAAEAWPRVHRRLTYALAPGLIDESCKDASRIYYLPACPEDAEPFALHHAGEWLDPDAFPDPPEPPRAAYTLPTDTEDRPPAELLLGRAVDRSAGEGRNNAGLWLACQLRDTGYSEGEADTLLLEYARMVAPMNAKGERYSDEEALATVRKAYSRPAREPWPESDRPQEAREARDPRQAPQTEEPPEMPPPPEEEEPPIPEPPQEDGEEDAAGEVIPHSDPAEMALCGSVLRGADVMTVREALEICDPADCYRKAHDFILGTVRDLLDRRERVDVVTVTEAMAQAGTLHKAGGVEYLRRLAGQPFGGEGLTSYARIVRDKSRLRGLLQLLRLSDEDARKANADPARIEEQLVRMLLMYRQQKDGDVSCYADVLEEEWRRIEAGESEPALEFGLGGVDRITGGLARKQVALVCGRPGYGKSVWCAMQLHHCAQTWGACLYVCLEMGGAEVVRRDLAGMTAMTYQELRESAHIGDSGKRRPLTQAAKDRLRDAKDRLRESGRNIFFDEYAGTLTKLISRVHRCRLQWDIQLLVVDYGQLVRDDTARGSVSKAEEVMRVARALKTEVAVPENIPVLVAVQANRNSERDGKTKTLSYGDLGWSGEWENVAGQIAFLNPDAERSGNDSPERRHVLLDIAKNRHGGKGQLPLILNGPRFRFEEEDRTRDDREAPPERAGRYGGEGWDE
jgi:replicative DNA helicase